MKIIVQNNGMQAKYIKHQDGDITLDGGESVTLKLTDGAVLAVDQTDEDMLFELKNVKHPQ
jgi:hypothetical protein